MPPPIGRATCGRPCSRASTSAATSPWSTASPLWWRHASGLASGDGTFDYWEIRADAAPAVEQWCGAWCRRHLARLHRHGQSRDHRRAHHRGSSTFRRPMAGSLRRRLGRRPGPALRHRRLAVRRVRTGGPATASCCSSRTGRVIATRQRPWSRRSSTCPASPVCRSPFTKSWRRTGTPCRLVAFVSRSSIAGTARPARPRANGCGSTSWRRRPSRYAGRR